MILEAGTTWELMCLNVPNQSRSVVMIELKEIDPQLAPMSLLLEADPSEECINNYFTL